MENRHADAYHSVSISMLAVGHYQGALIRQRPGIQEDSGSRFLPPIRPRIQEIRFIIKNGRHEVSSASLSGQGFTPWGRSYSVIDAYAPMYPPIMHFGIMTRIHDRVIHDQPTYLFFLHDFIFQLGFIADGLETERIEGADGDCLPETNCYWYAST